MNMPAEERKSYYQSQIEQLTPPISDWQETLLQIYQRLLDGTDLEESGSVDEKANMPRLGVVLLACYLTALDTKETFG